MHEAQDDESFISDDESVITISVLDDVSKFILSLPCLIVSSVSWSAKGKGVIEQNGDVTKIERPVGPS